MSRAAATGSVAVRYVEVPVEVQVPVEVRVVEKVEVIVSPKGTQWATALNVLASRLDQIDDNDLAPIAAAAEEMTTALTRRRGVEDVPAALPRGAQWAPALLTLARQVDGAGRHPLYDKDLDAVTAAANELIEALNRRLRHRRR